MTLIDWLINCKIYRTINKIKHSKFCIFSDVRTNLSSKLSHILIHFNLISILSQLNSNNNNNKKSRGRNL